MIPEYPFKIDVAPAVPARTKPLYSSGGRIRVEALLDQEVAKNYLGKLVTVCGWQKTARYQGGAKLFFIELNDGSSAKNIQVVVQMSGVPEDEVKRYTACQTSTAWRITGKLVASPKDNQACEILVEFKEGEELHILGPCTAESGAYPLAKKNHSLEYLREIQHLRARSYFMGAVTRVRNALAHATHDFFQTRGFLWIHTPLITTADCEGAGEMFQVTTILPEDKNIASIPTVSAKKTGGAKKTDDGAAATENDQKAAASTRLIDYKKDFFCRPAYLTVSGQLSLETYCCALSDVYTFGPTFRAENSHTSRHLAEFWMIEPELAFADLETNMRCAEEYLRYCVKWLLERHPEDVAYFERIVEKGLSDRLRNIADSNFARCSYTEAIELLKQQPKDRFEVNDIHWGMDLGSEHERFLAEEHFKKPVIVYDYPYDLKAFYMKLNPDGKTVRAMDILVPKVGEIVGGSQREEDLALLEKQIKDKNLNSEDYWWYKDLRRWGTVPHSGFGVGFERLIMLSTGIENIRDVIPFPRAAGLADF